MTFAVEFLTEERQRRYNDVQIEVRFVSKGRGSYQYLAPFWLLPVNIADGSCNAATPIIFNLCHDCMISENRNACSTFTIICLE